MGRILSIFFLTSLFINPLLNAQDLIILHTNDIHSHINGFSPESEYSPLIINNDETRGGMARFASVIKREKAKYGDKVIVADAGDFLMGTLFHTIEEEKGFQLNLMKKTGYDIVALGNHEFDFGIRSLYNILQNSEKADSFPIIIHSNFNFKKTQDDSLMNELFRRGIVVKKSIIQRGGYKIGFIGLIGKDAEESIPSNYGVEFKNIKRVSRKMAGELKKQGADLVVALSHSGIEYEKGEWSGEDIELAKAVDQIDIVIGGHSHSLLPQAIPVNNAIVVQTGGYGKNIGKIEVVFNQQGKPLFQYQLIPVNDEIKGDANVQYEINQSLSTIDEVFRNRNIDIYQPVFETKQDLIMDEHTPENSNLGPLIAKSIKYYIDENTQKGTNISIVASGVIRQDFNKGKKGVQSIQDVFNVMPLGKGLDNIPGAPLGRIYVTGYELKRVLELIIPVSEKKKNYYLYFDGVKIVYDSDKGFMKRIRSIEIESGDSLKNVDISKKSNELVSISANMFMLSFMSKLKKMSFGLVKVNPKDQHGNIIEKPEDMLIDINEGADGIQEGKEWLALYRYLSSFRDINNNGIPDLPELYLHLTNPVLTPYK